MDSKTLLDKSLSSQSEDEAIACLRMARKKKIRIDDIVGNSANNAEIVKYPDKKYNHEYKIHALHVNELNRKISILKSKLETEKTMRFVYIAVTFVITSVMFVIF